MKEFIKARAKERGISLKEISEALGLDSYPSFLRTIEKGDNLKPRQLKIIANLLGCSIDELVEGELKTDEDELSIKCDKCGNIIKYRKIDD